MARRTTGQRNQEEQSKEPFIPREDRPEVKISLDTPLAELRVRELAAILGIGGSGKNPLSEFGKRPIKDFFDKDWPEEAKDFLKEIKIEKIEKPEKPEKLEKIEKFEKNEKFEKREIKEAKNEKIELEPVFDPGDIIPDPRFEQVIQAVAGLTKQVSQLANQVEELRKRVGDR